MDGRTLNQGLLIAFSQSTLFALVFVFHFHHHHAPYLFQLSYVSGATTHEAKQTASAMAFFMHMYWSAGESMATKFLACFLVWFCFSPASGKTHFVRHIEFAFFFPSNTTRFESTETAMQSQTDEQLREDLLRRLVQRELLGPSRQILLDGDVARLPLRELPPGNIASLYLMFVAFARTTNSPAAGKTTFYKVARKWSTCLRFRRKSDHSLCVECSRLKAQINACKDSQLCAGMKVFKVFATFLVV